MALLNFGYVMHLNIWKCGGVKLRYHILCSRNLWYDWKRSTMFIDYAHNSVVYIFIYLNDKSICEYWNTIVIYLNMSISMLVWVEIFIMYVIFDKVC